jgi:putative two-component system response regulator
MRGIRRFPQDTPSRRTTSHRRLVVELAVALANELGLDGNRPEAIPMANLVHDLGKIHVPTEMLSRPGSLTDLGYQRIKIRAQVGYDIPEPVEFLGPVAQIARQHHECPNGCGFPNGLSGNEILTQA